MRHLALALVLSVIACSPTEPPARCTPGVQIPCACPGGSPGAQACNASGEGYGACVCVGGDADGDAVAVVDAPAADAVVVEDRTAPMDVVTAPDVVDAGTPTQDAAAADAVDASAPDVVDAAAPDVVDATAVDADPRQTPECRAVTQTCDGRVVDVQRGERDGGVTHHCGRCGNTCAAGLGCLTCVCIPL